MQLYEAVIEKDKLKLQFSIIQDEAKGLRDELFLTKVSFIIKSLVEKHTCRCKSFQS